MGLGPDGLGKAFFSTQIRHGSCLKMKWLWPNLDLQGKFRLLTVIGLVIWLIVHRKLKGNIRPRDHSLLSREKEISFLEDSSVLTPEERKKIRLAMAKKLREEGGGEEDTGRKPPIDIRELEDRYLGDDR